MSQQKEMGRLNGYKNKTFIPVVYGRFTLDLETHTDWKWGCGKKVFHAKGNQKKAGGAIPIIDKIDVKIKTIIRGKEGHYIMINGSTKKIK